MRTIFSIFITKKPKILATKRAIKVVRYAIISAKKVANN